MYVLRKRWILRMLAVSALAVLLMSFVTFPEEQLADIQVLRLGEDESDLGTADPHFAVSGSGRTIAEMVFNGLVRYLPGDISFQKMEPDLATEMPTPEILSDGRQAWTFNLRKGVFVHPFPGYPDGYELTAEDVVYSFEKAANPSRSAYAGDYSGMSFEALGDYVFRVILDSPVSPALFLPKVANYAGGFIVPKKAIEEIGDEAFKTHPVGTGPFMIDEHVPLESTTFMPNSRYFRGKPYLNSVILYYMGEIGSRELGLRSGELDMIRGPRESSWIDKMEAIPGIEITKIGPGEICVAHLNATIEPLNDLRVRQAIAYAINRDTLVEFHSLELSSPAYSPVNADFMVGGLTKAETVEKGLSFEFDVAKARELLADAGYPDGFTMEVISSEQPAYLNLYQLIQEDLKKIDIKMGIKVVDHPTYHSMIRQDLSPLVIYLCWRPNADVFLTRFYHSDSIVVSGAKPDTNFSHCAVVDELIEKARIELDADKQIETWTEANALILEGMYAYPMIQTQFAYPVQEYVEWGHPVISTLNYNPGITEQTRILAH